MKRTAIALTLGSFFLFSCQKESNDFNRFKTEPYTGPIIDMHIHAVDEQNSQSAGLGKTMRSPFTGIIYTASESAEDHRKDSFAKFREHNIVKAVVSGDFVKADHYAAESWHEHAPDLVIVGKNHDIPIDQLRKDFSDGKLHILAEVSPFYDGMLPTDERLEAYFDLAEELDLPVGFHLFPGGPPGIAYRTATKARAIHAKPLQLEEILISHPKMRIYIMHAAWPYLDDLKALMYAHPQVYVDIGVIDWILPRAEFHSFLKGLVDAGFGNRILFGTDQMIWVDTIDDAIEAVNSADFLSLEQKADIFYNNASRFLKLSEGEIQAHHKNVTGK